MAPSPVNSRSRQAMVTTQSHIITVCVKRQSGNWTQTMPLGPCFSGHKPSGCIGHYSLRSQYVRPTEDGMCSNSIVAQYFCGGGGGRGQHALARGADAKSRLCTALVAQVRSQ